jgi:hypothetical protein
MRLNAIKTGTGLYYVINELDEVIKSNLKRYGSLSYLPMDLCLMKSKPENFFWF